MAYEQLINLIRAELPTLSPQLANGARYILDNPDETALLSMRQIAARANVTPITLVRLAQRLDLPDWEALRRRFVDRLRTVPERYSTRADALIKSDKIGAILEKTAAAQQANLSYAVVGNKTDDIVRAATILAKAPRILVAGFRSCRPVAMAIAYLCRMLHSDVRVIGADGGSLEAELTDLSKDDVLVVVSFSYYSREIQLVIDAVKRHQATMISIVDSFAAPPVQASILTLRFTVDSPSFFPSIIGAIAIAESLAAAMLAKGGKTAAARVKRVESELIAQGAYLGVRASDPQSP